MRDRDINPPVTHFSSFAWLVLFFLMYSDGDILSGFVDHGR
jgi:hypothetical protein